MAAAHTIEVNGKAYAIRFGWNAVRRLQEVLKEPIHVTGIKLISGQAGLLELGYIFWAGLETARLKARDNRGGLGPYSIDEVGDMIDDDITNELFFSDVYPKIMDAFAEAFPQPKKEAPKQGDPPPADSTGTASSPPQPESA